MNAKLVLRAALIFSLLSVSACGFKPIYAKPEGASAIVNRQIAVAGVSAPEEVHLFMVDALRDRIIPKEGETPKYELYVKVDEAAQRLAVQIDATVTRYNYRLTGDYRLRNLATGKELKGKALAVTSYNIVSSQYSTLYAERAAREKAARLLAEKIERDIILRLDNPDAPEATAEPPEELINPVDPEDIGKPVRDSGDEPFLIDDGAANSGDAE